MDRALRQTVVIGPDGEFRGKAPGVAPGTTADLILLVSEKDATAEPAAGRTAAISRMLELRESAVAEGMEQWDIDRVNSEVAQRRYGDREQYL